MIDPVLVWSHPLCHRRNGLSPCYESGRSPVAVCSTTQYIRPHYGATNQRWPHVTPRRSRIDSLPSPVRCGESNPRPDGPCNGRGWLQGALWRQVSQDHQACRLRRGYFKQRHKCSSSQGRGRPYVQNCGLRTLSCRLTRDPIFYTRGHRRYLGPQIAWARHALHNRITIRNPGPLASFMRWPSCPQCFSTTKWDAALSSWHVDHPQVHQRARWCAETLQESGKPHHGGHPPPHRNKHHDFDGTFPLCRWNLEGPSQGKCFGWPEKDVQISRSKVQGQEASCGRPRPIWSHSRHT